MSLRGQRNVQRKNVAGGQQRVELRIFHPIPAGPLRCGQRIVSEHSRAKAAKNPGGDPADPARSDDADGFAENIETHQTVERKIMFAHTIVGAMDFAVQRQQQPDRVFRNGVRRIGRNTRHRQAERSGRREINVVEAGAAEGDEFDARIRQDFKTGTVQPVVDEHANRPRPFGGRRRVGVQTKVVEPPADGFVFLRLFKVLAVVGLGIVKGGINHDGRADDQPGRDTQATVISRSR